MRTILVFLYLLFYTILSIPMFIIAYFIGRKDPIARAKFSQPFVAWAFRCVLFISGVSITERGRENVLESESACYVFNHRGFFDIVVAYMLSPVPTAFVSKEEIGKIPMISRWMKNMNCLFLDRKDIRKGMVTINEGVELLKKGTNVFIAPEGTRNKGDGILKFHGASFKLADKSGRPVIPVVLNHTDEVFEKHLPWLHKTHVVIEYLPAVYMDQMDRAEKRQLPEIIRQRMLETYEANQSITKEKG